MEIVNYTEARSNLTAIMDKVCENHMPMAITRRKGKAVIMMSLEEYNAWQETMYLLRSETNRRRLAAAIQNVNQGNATERSLAEENE